VMNPYGRILSFLDRFELLKGSKILVMLIFKLCFSIEASLAATKFPIFQSMYVLDVFRSSSHCNLEGARHMRIRMNKVTNILVNKCRFA
jgi:hypothetical protein